MKLAKRRRRKPNLYKGAIAGKLGGFAGAWAMNQFQTAWSIAGKALERCCEPSPLASNRRAESSDFEANEGPREDATMKAANKIAQAVLHHELTWEQKQKLGPVVHFAFGTAMGGFYGAAAEYRREVTTGFGAAFSTALFIGADEIAVPAAGLSGSSGSFPRSLSRSLKETPLSTHAYALLSHLVYGWTTEAVRRTVRRALR
ncbi:MAG: DUF1440 domain-containing protein [Candidatus Korobacteraceae bacterium]